MLQWPCKEEKTKKILVTASGATQPPSRHTYVQISKSYITLFSSFYIYF